MTRFCSVLLWTAVFCLLLLAIDQLLVRVPARYPAHAAVATFYRDLRSRVVDLATGGKKTPEPVPAAKASPAPKANPKANPKAPPASVEAIIEQRQTAPPPAKPVARPPAAPESAPRYVFADDQGELHFAETLAEVPDQYRDKAKRLGE